MNQSKFPPGWDEEKVRRVLSHYDQQTEEEAVAEDEAAFENQTQTVFVFRSQQGRSIMKVDFLPFEDIRFQITNLTKEGDEFKELEERLAWPYEIHENTGALRGSVSIWSTSA